MTLWRIGAVGTLAALAGCTATVPAEPSEQNSLDGAAPAAATSPAVPEDQAQLDEELRDAAYRSDTDAAELLIAEGADVNEMDKTIESAYLIAASQADLPFMRLMLANGADVSATDSWGSTGLIRAAERGSYLVVGSLLSAGADPNQVNTLGYQAIHEAVWLGQDNDDYVDTVRVLSAAGVDLEHPSETEGLTPLDMVMDRGFTRLEATLRVQLEEELEEGPAAALFKAIETDDADLAARALREGAELNSANESGSTAFLLAVEGEKEATLRLFTALGADAGLADARGITPLVAAAAAGNADLVAIMAGAPGLNLDAADSEGHTALMHAVLDGDGSQRYQRTVDSLLAAGADPLVANPAGLTALDLAIAGEQDQLVTILEDASAG